MIELIATVPQELATYRLDKALALIFSAYSRERLKSWIVSGECLVDGEIWQPKDKLIGGEEITIIARDMVAQDWQPENMPLDVVYEDDDLIVINKPANMVTHPGAGNYQHTLANALLYRYPELNAVPRAGIVHRLDKDTTGLLVIARSLIAHKSLICQLQNKTAQRTYEALVWGHVISSGVIDEPMGRHPISRTKMAVATNGKQAVTQYRLIENYNGIAHLRVNLQTGRTHQIRVHMAHIRHPIIGDQTYGGRAKLPAGVGNRLQEYIINFKRQALHACKLTICHPKNDKKITWQVEIPDDFATLLDLLKENK